MTSARPSRPPSVRWLAAGLSLAAVLAGSVAGSGAGAATVAARPLMPVAAGSQAEVSQAEVSQAEPSGLRVARSFALAQLARTDRRLGEGRYPTVAPLRRWHTSGTGGWLAGFYPGSLWLAYELDGRALWQERAQRRQGPLRVRQHDTSAHDLGFLLQSSFGRAARLTGRHEPARVTSRAAASLASRWVPQAGAIRSWDGPEGQVTVIVDSLVNLELLYAGARLGGRTSWRDLATAHALTVAREHLRPDGSTFHVVRFDEANGDLVWRGTRQGLADDSTWARGQSWAVYGFTGAWRESRDSRLLEAARRSADFAIARLPADGVPYWDYDAPRHGDLTRDTTAAAVLASGLLELARVDPDPTRRATYRRAGMHTLGSLVGPAYLARGTDSPAILLHGRHDARYFDSGVTYADYYLLEALQRVQLLPSRHPALSVREVRRADDAVRVDLGVSRSVRAVSVRWRDGAVRGTRFRVSTSVDGRTWVRVRSGVSSGRTADAETYDVADRRARFVRVQVLGDGRVRSVRVR